MEGTRAGTWKRRNRKLCRMEEGQERVKSMIDTSGGANQDNGEGTKIWEPRILGNRAREVQIQPHSHPLHLQATIIFLKKLVHYLTIRL